ncbi:MAG TPA: GntG family PLP-dependent aldolase [Halobacteriales archaeon]|nr:GntG family PLP-dependent aldolase [Halobacteriales archaeon]
MIDLRSDTVTKPSDAMREAAASADVGDDVYGEDPSVNELESAAADLLGTEAALYCPSGTMANQVAVRTHTERGQEVLVELESHVYRWELGGLAQHSGLQVRTIDAAPRGAVAPEQVRAGYVEADAHRPGTGLLCLENTHNARGGAAIEPEALDAAAEAAHDLGVPVHLDGARLGNAAVAHDVPLDRFTEAVDSVSMCLSKGLGAPVGTVLGGPAGFVERARRTRKLFGGGMRQAGVIAAPGLLALGNVDRLAEDHENAARLADGLSGVEGLSVTPPETNIVLVDVADLDMSGGAFADAIEAEGVLASAFDESTVRFCTHLDVDGGDVEAAIDGIRRAV